MDAAPNLQPMSPRELFPAHDQTLQPHECWRHQRFAVVLAGFFDLIEHPMNPKDARVAWRQ